MLRKNKNSLHIDASIIKRVKSLSDEDILSWIDTTLNDLVAQNSGYRRGREIERLKEARLATLSLYQLFEELIFRRENKPTQQVTRQVRY